MKRLLAIIAIGLAAVVHAQPIEFVVKSSPGGPDDTVTRKIAEHLERTTNMNFVVMNKPGASHSIGYSHFESLNTPALIVADPNIKDHSVYNSAENLFVIGDFSNILFVRKGSGINTFNDFIELSKTREIKFGHGGEGTFGHIAAMKLCEKTIPCLLVPYKSGVPGMLDVMSGQIDAFALISYGTKNFIENDKFIPLMFFSNTKHPKYSHIPTLPAKYKSMEIKHPITIYARNLTEKQRKDILNSLNMLDKNFFLDIGLWVK